MLSYNISNNLIIGGFYFMNEVFENIITRRSVRAFNQAKKVDKKTLEDIVTAGMFAPTARNRQLTQFTVVAKESLINELATAVGIALERGSDYDFYKPTAIIITSCPKDSKFLKEDTSCALQNMFLYAHSLGVGSVWINQLAVCCNHENVREILTTLGVPTDHDCGGMMALGYPEQDISERDITRRSKAIYHI